MPFSAFCYFKADAKYVTGVDDDGNEYLLDYLVTLKSLVAANPGLIVTHRSYVAARPIYEVSLSIDGKLLASGEHFKIPVSRRYALAVRAQIRLAAAQIWQRLKYVAVSPDYFSSAAKAAPWKTGWPSSALVSR